MGPYVHLGGPRMAAKALVISAFPAFLVGEVFVRGLARLGVSELASFMSTMPLLMLGWFYLIGWLLDRRRHKRSLGRASFSYIVITLRIRFAAQSM